MRRLLVPAVLILVAGCGGTSTPAAPATTSAAPATSAPAPSTSAPAPAGAVVKVADTKLGKTLVDAEGRTLYLFEKDEGGVPACYDACAEEWPPYLTEGDPQAGAGADAALLGIVERKDGTNQVVYGEWPLYTYQDDTKPGDVTGHDKEEFGAEWYALTGAGKKAHG